MRCRSSTTKPRAVGERRTFQPQTEPGQSPCSSEAASQATPQLGGGAKAVRQGCRRPIAVAPLDIRGIFRELDAARVSYVLAGSVAAGAYGAAVDPRDLDVVPETTAANLGRLARLLEKIGAIPHWDPNWPFSKEEIAAWTPEPPTEENLDHLYETPLGLFDVVPWRAGRYEDLVRRAHVATVDGLPVVVAAPRDLLATMTRAKQAGRRPTLEEAEGAGRLPQL